jgi:transcriptional regulator with XRE-family HTH domain
LWQYANLEMRRTGYLNGVANDDAPPNRVRELRERKGLSQAELARLANVTPSALNKLENGARRLDQHWMLRLAPLLDCAPPDLLPIEQNPNHLGDAERALVLLFRSADETQRRQIFAMIQALLSPEEIRRLFPEAA